MPNGATIIWNLCRMTTRDTGDSAWPGCYEPWLLCWKDFIWFLFSSDTEKERRFRPTWPPWAGVTRMTRSLLWISINNAPRPSLPFWHMSGHLKGIKHKIIFLLQEVKAVWYHWRVTICLSYDLRWEFTWTIPSSLRPHRHVGIPQNSCSAWNKKSPKNS